MANLLTAIKAIVEQSDKTITNFNDGNNRANNMGEGLEDFVKNAFANSFNSESEQKKLKAISETFSYSGNKTNPPDMMLWDGDAIEVKKIESINNKLQLNSSHPKHKLFSTDVRINKSCRDCESWDEKDLVYTVGCIKDENLSSLWFVYGDCYAADEETYKKVESTIKDSLNTLGHLEINSTTNELSGVKNVDPLNITYLRVRGMWILENPKIVYKYLYEYDKSVKFQLISLMRKTKYDSFPQTDKLMISKLDNVSIKDVEIKDPNNTANLIDAKLIIFKVK